MRRKKHGGVEKKKEKKQHPPTKKGGKMYKTSTPAKKSSFHFDFAISRAALINGANVRRGSDILKKAC